jgi:hypothetical protein
MFEYHPQHIVVGFQVDLKQVNISIGDHDLLVDAHLRLKVIQNKIIYQMEILTQEHT